MLQWRSFCCAQSQDAATHCGPSMLSPLLSLYREPFSRVEKTTPTPCRYKHIPISRAGRQETGLPRHQGGDPSACRRRRGLQQREFGRGRQARKRELGKYLQKTLLSVGLGKKRSRSSLSRVSFKICVVCARVCKQKSVKIFAVRGSGTRL